MFTTTSSQNLNWSTTVNDTKLKTKIVTIIHLQCRFQPKIPIVSRLYYSEEHSEYALKQQQRFIYVALWSQATLSWDLLKNMH